MMAPVVGLLTLVLAAAPTAERPLLAVTGLRTTGFTEEQGAFYSEHLAQQLSLRGLRVVSPSQVAVVVGQARQRALLGCDEEGSECVAEIGGALGAQSFVTGSVARAGEAFQLDVAVLDTSTARHLALFSRRVDREEQLLGALADGAEAIADQLGATWRAPPAMPVTRKAGLAVGAVGAAALAVSVGLLLASSLERDKLSNLSLSYQDALRARDNGRLFQTCGFVGLGVTAAALGVATMLWLVGATAPVQGALIVDGRSVRVALVGRWP